MLLKLQKFNFEFDWKFCLFTLYFLFIFYDISDGTGNFSKILGKMGFKIYVHKFKRHPKKN